jgi:alpha-galactosidase
MVNPDSNLYRNHPDWCLQIPNRESLLARNQMVLDFTNPAVIEYLQESFETTFRDVNISYFKWDMNRHLCALGSAYLPQNRQKEIAFRYMKGVYTLLSWFREKFPHAVIETCSGGGGRYDLGMMPYGIRIWASDNTDPYARMNMQANALLAYPAATMSCHVSNPQENLDSLTFRYHVAAQGMLGYELNILDMSDSVKKAIKNQISEYKTLEQTVRLGEYYCLASPKNYPYWASCYVNQNTILFSLMAKENCPKGNTKKLKIPKANPKVTYTDLLTGKQYTGKELKEGLVLPLTGKPFSSRLFFFCVNE